MLKLTTVTTLVFACLAAAFTTMAPISSATAAQSRAQAREAARDQRAVARQQSARRFAATTGESREPIKGLIGLRDRSTIYHADGRLNGREFFERLQEQTGGGGQ